MVKTNVPQTPPTRPHPHRRRHDARPHQQHPQPCHDLRPRDLQDPLHAPRHLPLPALAHPGCHRLLLGPSSHPRLPPFALHPGRTHPVCDRRRRLAAGCHPHQ
ncbi:MAG: hypothetical protein MZV64_17265 [Ignavibacteriales bacterium]|nr:hypothetical protein [Ignavibacteriales bacterium]